MSTPPPAQRQSWTMVAFSMAMATVIYGFVIFSFHGGRWESPDAQEPPRLLFWAGAAVALIASVTWTQLRLRAPIRNATEAVPPGELMEPTTFQVLSMVSLALAEAACILGFVQAFLYRTPVRDYVPFGLASLVVIVADTIPVGLRYWRERERRQQPASARAPLE